ncbi:hypothetical protein V6N13_005469 [Hibiscus sabdariffa]
MKHLPGLGPASACYSSGQAASPTPFACTPWSDPGLNPDTEVGSGRTTSGFRCSIVSSISIDLLAKVDLGVGETKVDKLIHGGKASDHSLCTQHSGENESERVIGCVCTKLTNFTNSSVVLISES